MKKDTFLTIIQSSARRPGTNAARVWERAVKMAPGDTRWGYIHAESFSVDEVLLQYCRYFGGVEYQEPQRSRRMTKVERWEKKLEKTLKMIGTVSPECMEAFLRNVADLEEKLAYAKANNL